MSPFLGCYFPTNFSFCVQFLFPGLLANYWYFHCIEKIEKGDTCKILVLQLWLVFCIFVWLIHVIAQYCFGGISLLVHVFMLLWSIELCCELASNLVFTKLWYMRYLFPIYRNTSWQHTVTVMHEIDVFLFDLKAVVGFWRRERQKK